MKLTEELKNKIERAIENIPDEKWEQIYNSFINSINKFENSNIEVKKPTNQIDLEDMIKDVEENGH